MGRGGRGASGMGSRGLRVVGSFVCRNGGWVAGGGWGCVCLCVRVVGGGKGRREERSCVYD